MGTTATTNLALIKPDTSESIKEDLPTFTGWADQNEKNCDKTDGLFRASNSTWVATWTGVGSNPVLGAGGFVEGKYLRAFPRMVFGFFRIYTGAAGFTVGSGLYKINVPFNIAPELKTFNDSSVVGRAILHDDSAVATCQEMLVVYNNAQDAIFLRPSAGGSWNPTSPITIAQQDRIAGYFCYPTADA